MKPDEQSVIIVTGASGNLGSAVADFLLGAGASVAVADTRADRLEAKFGGRGERCLLLGNLDLTDPGDAGDCVNRTVTHFGSVYGVVNIAGGFRGGTPVHETPADDWDTLFALNVKTAVNMCRAAIGPMRHRGLGRIVNVAAMPALKAPAGLAAYSASKAGVLRLTESLAEENKQYGITVNAILPGTIDTPQNREAMSDADTSKWVPPEAIAAVVGFLLSEQAWPITGGAIPVSGKG